ncbi:uncharacterized protein [Epargyreus clarus]|uniref:uncharacterized protein n=1 Tax=Epargyreus clarus TaxID=520877 RepID=UPI003C2E1F36
MTKLLLFIVIIIQTWARNVEIIDMCSNLKCDNVSNVRVCGIRNEETMLRLKLFENECALLKHGCSVGDNDVYGLINMKYCRRVLIRKRITDEVVIHKTENISLNDDNKSQAISERCKDDCDSSVKDKICGIRQDGEGYRVRLFESKCQLEQYNCDANVFFTRTDMFICDGTFQAPQSSIKTVSAEIKTPPNTTNNTTIIKTNANVGVDSKTFKNLIVIDNSVIGRTNNANETIDNFFAATHVLDLPIKQIDEKDLKTRRMRVQIFGPVKVFKPWITVPKKIYVDRFHTPTLSTCYHKCPTKCPDTYAPVCGVPGIKAREPSIMFQNHCYMDVAQCKMFWENKSETAATSSYIECSFLFCLGDQLNGLYRFLPLIKTLQHMGRLKKKGRFRYKLRNMKFLNELAIKEPKLMG